MDAEANKPVHPEPLVVRLEDAGKVSQRATRFAMACYLTREVAAFLGISVADARAAFGSIDERELCLFDVPSGWTALANRLVAVLGYAPIHYAPTIH